MNLGDAHFAMRTLPLLGPVLAAAVLAFVVKRRAVFVLGALGALTALTIPETQRYEGYSSIEAAVMASLRGACRHSLFFGWLGAMVGVAVVLVSNELSAMCKPLTTRPRRRSTAGAIVVLWTLAVGANTRAADFNKQVDVGDTAPVFEGLEGTDGERHSLVDFAESRLVVVAFTCNTCPMAKAYEERFVRFADEYRDHEVAFVAINCNTGPADQLDAMRERAGERGFKFPYLHDPAQDVGRAYGATVTPHLFVLDQDRRIVYMGAFDDKQDAGKAKRHYVRDAVEALLAGRMPEITETRQFGCSIEYQRAPK